MQCKGMLAWIAAAAVTITGIGCSHIEKYTDKLGKVSHGADAIQSGATQVDQAFRDNPAVTEAAPDQQKKPKEQKESKDSKEPNATAENTYPKK